MRLEFNGIINEGFPLNLPPVNASRLSSSVMEEGVNRHASPSNEALPFSLLGTAISFVRSASPWYVPQTHDAQGLQNREPLPAANLAIIDNPFPMPEARGTLEFINQTTALASLGSTLLGLPSEVTHLLNNAALLSSVGLMIQGVRNYVSHASSQIQAGAVNRVIAVDENGLDDDDGAKESVEEESDAPENVATNLLTAMQETPAQEMPAARTRHSSRVHGAGIGKRLGSAAIICGGLTAVKPADAQQVAVTSASSAATTSSPPPSSATATPTHSAISAPSASALPVSTTAAPIPIPISSVADLAKIGRDSGFPLNGHYVQMCDIDATLLNNSIGGEPGFCGVYDGQFHRISNLSQCFFERLINDGELRNLHVVDAVIISHQPSQPSAVLAALMDKSTINNVTISNSSLMTSGAAQNTGLVAGSFASESRIINVSLDSCNVSTTGLGSMAGGFVGEIYSGQLDNLRANNVAVSTTNSHSNAGIGGGYLSYIGRINRFSAQNCTVSTQGSSSSAGIMLGDIIPNNPTQVDAIGLDAQHCIVSTEGDDSPAGGVAGKAFTAIQNIQLNDCIISSKGTQADAGLVVGKTSSNIKNVTLVNSNVSALKARAGIVGSTFLAEVTITELQAVNTTYSSFDKSLNLCRVVPKSVITQREPAIVPAPQTITTPFVLNLSEFALGMSVGVGVTLGIGLLTLGGYFFHQRFLSHQPALSFIRRAEEVPEGEYDGDDEDENDEISL